MGHETDHLPNRPLPFETLTKLTAVHSLCLVNHSAPNACQNIMWKGREGEYPDRNLHLSIPHSTLFNFSQPGFISRLAFLAQSFCCNFHRGNVQAHAYFAYLWVADYISELGPSHTWDKEQLHWFGLRHVTDLLHGQRPPFMNFDQDVCYLDTLERCADYLSEDGRQKFVNSMRNMMTQGKAMTNLGDLQMVKVNELLEGMKGPEDPVVAEGFWEKPQCHEERESSTDVESEAGRSELEDTLVVDEAVPLPTARLPIEYLTEDRKQDFEDWIHNTVPPGKAMTKLGDEQLVKIDEDAANLQRDTEPVLRTSTKSEADEPDPQDTIHVDEQMRVSSECLSDSPKRNSEDEMQPILRGEENNTGLDSEQSANIHEPLIPTGEQLIEDDKKPIASNEQLVEFEKRLVNNEEQLMQFEERLIKTEEWSVKTDELLPKLQRNEEPDQPMDLQPDITGMAERLQDDEKRESSIHVETQIGEFLTQLSPDVERELSIGAEPETEELLGQFQHDEEQGLMIDVEREVDGHEAQTSMADEPEVDDFVVVESEAGKLLFEPEAIESGPAGSEIDQTRMDKPEQGRPGVDPLRVDKPEVDKAETDELEIDEPEADESESSGMENDEPAADEPEADDSVNDVHGADDRDTHSPDPNDLDPNDLDPNDLDPNDLDPNDPDSDLNDPDPDNPITNSPSLDDTISTPPVPSPTSSAANQITPSGAPFNLPWYSSRYTWPKSTNLPTLLDRRPNAETPQNTNQPNTNPNPLFKPQHFLFLPSSSTPFAFLPPTRILVFVLFLLHCPVAQT